MNPITAKSFGAGETCAAESKNIFLEFKRDFFVTRDNGEKNSAEMAKKSEKAVLKAYSDFRYAAYINGKFVLNAQFVDPAGVKTYAERDVSKFLRDGENEIYILIFHMAADHQVIHASKNPFVAFEITRGDETLVKSDEQTLCRVSKNYLPGDTITFQIGDGFNYDFCAEPEWWERAELLPHDFIEKKRPILNCEIAAPAESVVAAQGEFVYNGVRFADDFKGEPCGKVFSECYMLSERFNAMTGEDRIKRSVLSGGENDCGEKAENYCCKNDCGENEENGNAENEKNTKPLKFTAVKRADSPIKPDGVFVLVDLKRESCGYLTFSVEVKHDCKAVVCWGEHLADLRVRSGFEGRNFAFGFNLKKGENVFDDYILRLGLRYLCLFVESDEVVIKRLTVRETRYPFNVIKKDFGDGLLNEIYKIGRRTLELCAHDHYEDCPWREQALYGMDSRNQMLFGYGAFKEYDFARASLKMFADSLRPDGLVELCPPSRAGITIPSFTLYWIIAVCENAEADYNEKFISEILPFVEKAMDEFIARTGEKGVTLFVQPEFWNFHEWRDGLDGGEIWRKKACEPDYDCIITALCAIAADKLSALFEYRGETRKAEKYKSSAQKIRGALEYFYNAENGFYASYINTKGQKTGYHEYAQAMVLCAGAAKGARAEKLINALKNGNDALIKMTYSAMLMKYVAIADSDGDYEWCVKNVKDVFGKAVLSGATSFYETEYGEADFGDAGSLCHGWSAVACYVLDKRQAASDNKKEKLQGENR